MRVIFALTALAVLLSLGACSRKKEGAYAETYSAAPLPQPAASAMTAEYRMQPHSSWSRSTVQPENEVVEQDPDVKFEAARAKADRLGGVHRLTQADIDGLSYEQIQRLRGY
jgi:hypothetical protein